MNPPAAKSSRALTAIVCSLICVAGLARAGSLIWPHYGGRQPSPDAIQAVTQALVTDAINLNELLSQTGIDRVERQQFDDSAAVLSACGVDGQPGQAGQDDNLDGIADNAAELGAVRSDDQCVAPWESGYKAARAQACTSTISTRRVRQQPADRPHQRNAVCHQWSQQRRNLDVVGDSLVRRQT